MQGAEVVAAVTPAKAPALERAACAEVLIGDLEDAENLAKSAKAELFIGNSHAVSSAERLHVPLIQAGFPQYALIGGYQRTWIGYRGIRDTCFDAANRFHHLGTGEIAPYRSRLSQKLSFDAPVRVVPPLTSPEASGSHAEEPLAAVGRA